MTVMKSLWIGLFLVLTAITAVEARQVTDMAGRTVDVPEHIERVIGSVAPVTWMVYAIDPRLPAGLNSKPSAQAWRYLKPELKRLPIIGSLGGTRELNREALLALHPDVVVLWTWGQAAAHGRWAKQLSDGGIPVVFVTMDHLDQYPATIRFLGDLLNRRERAEQLAIYGEQALTSVRKATATLTETEKVRVYYAEGMDGLETEPRDSFHAELIPLAGGVNVHRGALQRHAGREKLSMEQVLLYDPDHILTQEKTFFQAVATDRRWQSVRAVRDGRVWLIPDLPLNWFDRPPTFMRFLGLRWLAHRFYPELYPLDAIKETEAFYRLFLGAAVLPEDLENIEH